MTFILRLPAMLVLLALMLLSFAAAFATTAVLASLPIDLATVLDQEQIAIISAASWPEVGLWAGAGLFFLISVVRLIRRTQGFWTWLLGFACYAGRWAWVQQNEGGLLATVQSVDPNTYLQPAGLLADTTSTESQLAILGIALIAGIFIFIVDAADRAYWDKHGG